MTQHRFAQFEVATAGELIRVSLGASLLIGLGEPLLTVLARTLPRPALQGLVRLWASAAIRFLDLQIDIEGLEHVDEDRLYVVAPLHEGFADALVLSRLPIDLRYVARDELFQWPRLGPFLRRSDQILLSPEAPASHLRGLVDECRRTFPRGQSVVIFPQGSILGVEAAFAPSVFRIADMLDKPVLPVVITGTHRVWEHPHSNRLRFGQTASVRVLPALPIGRATESMRDVEIEMKRIALSAETAPPRRFDPRRDGFWDGYRYEIDPHFPELEELVRRHRS